jgi:phosphohistidine phosphatase
MKKIYICRHGKAEINSVTGNDFDRNLALRGMKDAKKNSKLAVEKGAKPDLLLSSTANRAFQTAIQYALRFDLAINYEPTIYEANLKTLLSVVNNLPNEANEVMIFGHNPGFSMLASYLTNQNFADLPTASCLAIEFKYLDWNEISKGSGKVLFEITD